MTTLEICVDSVDSLAVASVLPIARIELCGPLAVGGTTPSAGLIAAARGSLVPVYVMIRPRAGDFCFSEADERAMEAEIDAVRAAGLAGVVLGASRPDGTLDTAMLARLTARSAGLGRTLHRAFDLTPDPFTALEEAVSLRFERILSSGQQPNAPAGADCLAALQARAGGRISIMAGGGVRADNVHALVAHTRVGEVHASCRTDVRSDARAERHAALGFDVRQGESTSPTVAGAILAELRRIHAP